MTKLRTLYAPGVNTTYRIYMGIYDSVETVFDGKGPITIFSPTGNALTSKDYILITDNHQSPLPIFMTLILDSPFILLPNKTYFLSIL